MFQEKEELPKKPLVMNPLVIALGEKNTQSDDELSFKSGEVFESIPASNTQTKSGEHWVQAETLNKVHHTIIVQVNMYLTLIQ